MAENSDNLTNMERYYEAQADAALEAFNNGDWKTSDTICTELLALPRLPDLWRAQCNLLLASTDDNTAISFAKEAVKWYDKVLENGGDEHIKKHRDEAALIIKAAEEKKEAETSEDKVIESKEESEGEDGLQTEPADDGEESSNDPELAEEEHNGKE